MHIFLDIVFLLYLNVVSYHHGVSYPQITVVITIGACHSGLIVDRGYFLSDSQDMHLWGSTITASERPAIKKFRK